MYRIKTNKNAKSTGFNYYKKNPEENILYRIKMDGIEQKSIDLKNLYLPSIKKATIPSFYKTNKLVKFNLNLI